MSFGFKLLVPCALALCFPAACAPDLDSLSAHYSASAGASSTGNSAGGRNSTGGMDNSGGTPAGVDVCANHKKDSNESDVDCGGSSKCDRCATSNHCTVNGDCESEFCKDKLCAEPTCSDKVKNQNETGVDCGGSCKSCDLGVVCETNDDCTDQYCVDEDGDGEGPKVCSDHCLSGAKESDETDKDCGGTACEPCADGRRCAAAGDCTSLVCSNQVCQAARCDDLIKNQDESDKDCGGACAASKPCAVAQRCNSEADCESWICSNAGKCTPDIIVKDNQVIDNFEDGDFSLPVPAIESRAGNWYPFNDGTGVQSYDLATISRSSSKKGFVTKGKDFSNWGSGVGVDMAGATKAPYDASKYTGLTFWARAELAANQAEQSVTVVFPDEDTDPGIPAPKRCTTCDHHYNKPVQLTKGWQRFIVNFADLILEPGTIPAPTAFKPERLVSVQFRVAPGNTYAIYLDDVAFVQ